MNGNRYTTSIANYELVQPVESSNICGSFVGIISETVEITESELV